MDGAELDASRLGIGVVNLATNGKVVEANIISSGQSSLDIGARAIEVLGYIYIVLAGIACHGRPEEESSENCGLLHP